MKRRFNINVMGQEFYILSDKGDEYVENVVQYVNKKAEEIGRSTKDVSTLGIAILAALNIADDLFELRNEQTLLCSQVRSKTERLIEFVEKSRLGVDDTLRCS